MALTVTESSAVNTLLRWVLREPRNGRQIRSNEAMEAAALLADHANKTLAAGLSGVKVREGWLQLEDDE